MRYIKIKTKSTENEPIAQTNKTMYLKGRNLINDNKSYENVPENMKQIQNKNHFKFTLKTFLLHNDTTLSKSVYVN